MRCTVTYRIEAFAIFLLFCLLIGLGAWSASRAHGFDMAWVSLLWTFIIVAGVHVLFKVRTRRLGLSSVPTQGPPFTQRIAQMTVLSSSSSGIRLR